MKTVSIELMALGMFQSNCCLAMCNETKETVVIDPGAEAQRIIDTLTRMGAQVTHLLHTHTHIDHVGATAELKQFCGADIVIPRQDELLYQHAPVQAQAMGVPAFQVTPADRLYDDGDVFSSGQMTLTAIHTPGHSPGSSCLLLEAPDAKILFSGDTLFRGSIGRTDLPGGSFEALIGAVRNKLFTLEPELVVIPGHGDATTIGEEMRTNPFFR